MNRIGERLRVARTGRNLNLRQLAEASGVSASMLCTIENGKTTPSVQSLMAIATALGMPPSYFFGELDPPLHNSPEANAPIGKTEYCPVVRADSCATICLAGGVRWSRLTPGTEEGVEISEIRYDPGACSGQEFYTHSGREWGYVMEGELCVDLAFESYALRPGDSITFESQTPHRLRNAGDAPMRAIWVNMRGRHEG